MSAWWQQLAARRAPDVIIGGEDTPYLKRWFIILRNPFFNIYLHQFLRSDDDRALHDHPWVNFSYLLEGEYTEHTINAGGINIRTKRSAGQWKFRFPRGAHRLELPMAIDGHGVGECCCWTIFITGPRIRNWGFHCPNGWIPWQRFTNPEDGGRTVGPGCDG